MEMADVLTKPATVDKLDAETNLEDEMHQQDGEQSFGCLRNRQSGSSFIVINIFPVVPR